MWEWLISPIDAGRAHDMGTLLSWHGRFMVLAWGICAPLGVVVARYLKVLPWQDWPRQLDSQVWWVLHRVLQYGATALTVIALIVILFEGREYAAATHRLLGYLVVALTVAQVLGGWLRGSKGGPTEPSRAGDHFDMTPRRLVFEYVHKICGYAALLVSGAAILTGLWLANGPVWMWLCLGLWWLALAVVAAVLQRRGWAVDTYQAIWGPDPALPGNRTPPIGIGVRRH